MRDKLIDAINEGKYDTLELIVMTGDEQLAQIRTGACDNVWVDADCLVINKSDYDNGLADFSIQIPPHVEWDEETECYSFNNYGLDFIILL